MPGRRFRLVEALQRAVVAFVETPVADDRYPHQVHFVEHDPQRADGALEHRRVGDVEAHPHVREVAAGACGLCSAGIRQVDVRPAGEKILQVPDALTVAAEHEFAGHPLSSRSCCVARILRRKPVAVAPDQCRSRVRSSCSATVSVAKSTVRRFLSSSIICLARSTSPPA